MNSVSSLQSQTFSSRSLDEKLEIKRLGRPTPAIILSQTVSTKGRTFNRVFNVSMFEKHDWLCSCDIKNALFCFPCVLFGGEDMWTKTGMTDVNHLTEKVKKHEASSAHVKNVLSLVLMGNVNIAAQLDGVYRRNIELRKLKVANNRYVLNIIINCIRFCGAFELALRGHDETDSSSNPSIVHGLINFSAELDNALKTHLESSTILKGTSKTIQNQLLAIMLEVCHEEITRQIKDADFLAVIVDETSDVSNKCQMSIIYRYVYNNRPIERFWGFIVPSGYNAPNLAKCITDELDRHLGTRPRKLIAQTYDGTSVISGSRCGVQALVKKHYQDAAYVHCYAHQLNIILQNAASANRSVKIFFSNLQGICSFFSSPQRTAILNNIVEKRLRRCVPTQWNFQARSVNIVYEHRNDLIACMKAIQDENNISHSPTITQACGYEEILKNEKFIFWLSFFYRIMPHIDILFKETCNPSYLNKQIKAFEHIVSTIRDNVDVSSIEEDAVKKRKIDDMEKKNQEAKTVCDMIVQEVRDRFEFKGHLSAGLLFLPHRFADYHVTFPENHLREVYKCYAFVDNKKLRTELTAIYEREEFREITGALPLFEFICENNLKETFSECVKLLKVLFTIPMTSSEAERKFSTLKRIKTFQHNTVTQDRLSALAMLSVERDLIMQIPNFNQRVIDKFAATSNQQGQESEFPLQIGPLFEMNVNTNHELYEEDPLLLTDIKIEPGAENTQENLEKLEEYESKLQNEHKLKEDDENNVFVDEDSCENLQSSPQEVKFVDCSCVHIEEACNCFSKNHLQH